MGNRIVLCVDDEEIVLKSLEMELAPENDEYQLEMATNGIDAMQLVGELFEEGNELAVVISDHIMPEMKGDELLIKIHEDHPATVNILLTGQSQIEGVTNAINHAALYRYIAKPWEKEDLKLTLHNALLKFDTDQRLLKKEQIIKEMNEKLWESREAEDGDKKSDDSYNPEDKLSDEELYDQIYYSRFFQSLDSKEKKWFALASIGLINADRKLTKTEMNYINSIVRSDREKESVEHYVDLVKRKSKPNLDQMVVSSERKYRLLTYLSQILISAKRIGPQEEEYFIHICDKLGIDPQATNDSMKIIKHKILGNYMGFKLKEYLSKSNPLFATQETKDVKIEEV